MLETPEAGDLLEEFVSVRDLLLVAVVERAVLLPLLGLRKFFVSCNACCRSRSFCWDILPALLDVEPLPEETDSREVRTSAPADGGAGPLERPLVTQDT